LRREVGHTPSLVSRLSKRDATSLEWTEYFYFYITHFMNTVLHQDRVENM